MRDEWKRVKRKRDDEVSQRKKMKTIGHLPSTEREARIDYATTGARISVN